MRTLYLGLDPSRYPQKKGLYHMPLIEICPFPLSEIELDLRRGAVADICVLTSRQACHCLFKALNHFNLILPYQKMHFVSVGKGTSEALASYDVKQIDTANIETGEGVISLLKQMDLRNKKIIYPHSKLSRALISDFLKPWDAIDVALYTSRKKNPIPGIELETFDSIVFTSSSVVDAFDSFFEPSSLKGKNIISIGPLTKRRIKTLLSI
jgi:uroporphyrinogen-III synthase